MILSNFVIISVPVQRVLLPHLLKYLFLINYQILSCRFYRRTIIIFKDFESFLPFRFFLNIVCVLFASFANVLNFCFVRFTLIAVIIKFQFYLKPGQKLSLFLNILRAYLVLVANQLVIISDEARVEGDTEQLVSSQRRLFFERN